METPSLRVDPNQEPMGWEQLYRTHRASLVRWLTVILVQNVDLAEDVAQEAFWRIRNAPFLTRELLFMAANRLASNAKRDWVRRHRPEVLQCVEDLSEPPEMADAPLHHSEARRAAAHMLAQLPEAERQVIRLWANELSRQEIALALGISERTVRLRAEKGRRQLRELAQRAHEEGMAA